MQLQKLWFVGWILIFTYSIGVAETLVFQQGVNGYSGVVDKIDSGWIRFEISGIPNSIRYVSATLEIHASPSDSSGEHSYRVLAVSKQISQGEVDSVDLGILKLNGANPNGTKLDFSDKAQSWMGFRLSSWQFQLKATVPGENPIWMTSSTASGPRLTLEYQLLTLSSIAPRISERICECVSGRLSVRTRHFDFKPVKWRLHALSGAKISLPNAENNSEGVSFDLRHYPPGKYWVALEDLQGRVLVRPIMIGY